VRYIINRFKDQVSLVEWENSGEAIKLLEEVNNYTTRHYERATGLETGFSLPRLKGAAVPPPPPRWKMAIVSFIGAYCISSVARHILSLYLGQMPLLINLLMTVILVLDLAYFAMPLLSRLFRPWLYPETK
jgi:antibiotic biosynthesis monooxygenase (ABM) superfamily enzyme